jgi:hypothetical protein
MGGAGDRREALKHFSQRIAGEADEVDEAARFHVAEGVLLQDTDVGAEFEQAAPTRIAGMIDEFVMIGDAALRVVDFVAEGGEAGHVN